jgi:hypothetical protein
MSSEQEVFNQPAETQINPKEQIQIVDIPLNNMPAEMNHTPAVDLQENPS